MRHFSGFAVMMIEPVGMIVKGRNPGRVMQMLRPIRSSDNFTKSGHHNKEFFSREYNADASEVDSTLQLERVNRQETCYYNQKEKVFRQGVTIPTGLLVLPAGNFRNSQEIQPKCPVIPSTIMSEEGKSTLNY